MEWMDTSDLEFWAKKPASKTGLPLLISRLIRATSTKIESLNIPKGKGTYRGGFDGVIVSSEATEFIPEGLSLWEFGSTGAEAKADEDYDKRTADPKGYNIGEATFVFVTLEVWEKSNEWIEKKKAEGKWQDIRVCNAAKLVEWLSIAPLQSYWLAKEINKAPNDGVESTEDFWDNWKTGPEYVLQPEIITTGREKESNELNSALSGSPCIISVQASSRDEAIAFVTGSIMQFDENTRESVFSKCVIVENEASFKTLVANNDQLIIIAKMENSNAYHRAVAKGHFVILPMGPDEQPSSKVNLILPRLNREGFTNALIKSGVNEARSQSLSKESLRNIIIMRRLEKFDFDKPVWAKSENVTDIIPALLIGKWDENNEKDKKILSALAGESYEIYIAKLSKWKYTQDTPIYQIGSKWRVSSPLDIWSHCAKYITTENLNKFSKIFLETTRSVKEHIGSEFKIAFSFVKNEDNFSRYSREGILQSLILIAVYGDEFKIALPQGGQSFADGLIYSLLKDADTKLLCSINDIMPLIAEASPASFLTGIEQSLNGEVPTVKGVFNEIDNGISPVSYHTGLLWALESLAWMPESLSRVSIIFAKLAELDPGGSLSNRPANSLIQIFLPWHPQTYATLDQRLQTLSALNQRFPDIAWNLFMKLLPHHNNGVAFMNHKCRWRKFNYSEPTVTYGDIFSAYSEILNLCLISVGENVDKIVALLHISDAKNIDTARILEYIKSAVEKINDNDHKIWAELRKTLSHHRTSPTADWALSEEKLKPYVELYELFTPQDNIEANKWLFQDHYIIFPEGRRLTIDEKTELLLKKRIEALKSIEKEIHLQGIVDLLPQIIPYIVGDTLGYTINDEKKLLQIFEQLNGNDKRKLEMLNAIIFRVYFLKGFDWIKNLYAQLINKAANATSLANILIPLPQTENLWSFLETTSEDVQNLYWKNFKPWFGPLSSEYKEIGLKKLVEAERYGVAIDEMSDHLSDISTETIHSILEAAGINPTRDLMNREQYLITMIFEELDKRGNLDESRLAKLETYYLSYLTAFGSNRKPKMIHNELGTSPASFIQILKWVYAAKVDENNGIEDQGNSSLAHASYLLLHSWETIPGTKEDGSIDYNHLEEWVSEVRKQADAVDLLKFADAEIARVLACYKSEGEIWPSEEICKIIDEINTESIRNNFYAAIYNERGSTVRGVFDGGAQERVLAGHFRGLAEKHAIKWPITSSILSDLAKEYELMGKSEDRQALETDMEY